MTEETPKPPETFRSHLPALLGSVAGTLLSTLLAGHFFGKEGRDYALIAGSCISGSASWWTERVIRRSQAIAKAKLEAQKKKGAPLSIAETQVIEAVHRSNFNWRFRGIHYRTIAALALGAFLVAFLTVTLLDQFGTHKASTSYYRPAPAPSVVTSTAYVPVTVAPTYTPLPASTPAETTMGTPTPSPSPSPSLSPSSLLPGFSPSATPTTTQGVLP